MQRTDFEIGLEFECGGKRWRSNDRQRKASSRNTTEEAGAAEPANGKALILIAVP